MLLTYDDDMYPRNQTIITSWHQSNLVEWRFCGFLLIFLVNQIKLLFFMDFYILEEFVEDE